MSNTLTTHLSFLWAGLLKHGQTGGLVPSQRFLIDRMIAPVPRAYCGQIIELGSGTGALTLRLAARCLGARILACEINPTLARASRDNLGRAGHGSRVEIVSDSAEDLLSDLSRRAAAAPDYVLSGIPLGNLGRERARALVDTVHRALGVRGMFIQFQHSLLDRKAIRARFPRLRIVPVFLNVPPAFVYFAQK